MEYLVALIFGVFGGCWRRYFGMAGGRRSLKYCMLPLLCLPVWYFHGPKTFLSVAIISAVYWSFGHVWDKGFMPLFWRYTVPAMILGIIASVLGLFGPGIAIAGLVIAAVYDYNFKHADLFPYKNEILDGYGAYSELSAGFLVYAAIALL